MDALSASLSSLKICPPTSDLAANLKDLPEDVDIPSTIPYAISAWYTTNTQVCLKVLEAFGERGASWKEAFLDVMEGVTDGVPFGEGSEEGEVESQADAQNTDSGPDPLTKCRGAIHVLAYVMTRIKAKKPSSFILTATRVIHLIIERTLGSIYEDDDPVSISKSKEKDAIPLRDLFLSCLEFIRELTTIQAGGDPWIGSRTGNYLDFVTAQSHLATFLLRLLPLFRSYILLPRNLSIRYLDQIEPKFRRPGASHVNQETEIIDGMWRNHILVVCEILGVGTEKCLEIVMGYTTSASGTRKPLTSKTYSNEDSSEACSEDVSTSEIPFEPPPDLQTALGAFLVLSSTILTKQPRFSYLPSTLPFLSALLSINGSVSPSDPVDESVFWLFKCLRDGGGGWEKDDGALFRIVQLIPMIAATSPEPNIRFVALRLLHFVILKLAPPPLAGAVKSRFKRVEKGREDLQLLFLKDLIGESPWKDMRGEAVGILQAILQEKFTLKEFEGEKEKKGQESIFMSPYLMEELKSVFWKLGEEEDGEGIICENLNWVVKRLGFWYWLLVRDEKNVTGIRSPNVIRAWDQNLVDPINKRVLNLKKKLEADETEEAGKMKWEIEIVQENLERVKGALVKYGR